MKIQKRIISCCIIFIISSQVTVAYFTPNEFLPKLKKSYNTRITPKKLNKNKVEFKFNQIYMRGKIFDLEIANTREKRKKGLMYRKSLEKKRGMIFVYEKENKSSFWMKNVEFPLDIIWINKQYKIVYIAHSLEPNNETIVTTPKKAKYVLEIQGGLSKKYHFKRGTKVKFKYNKHIHHKNVYTINKEDKKRDEKKKKVTEKTKNISKDK